MEIEAFVWMLIYLSSSFYLWLFCLFMYFVLDLMYALWLYGSVSVALCSMHHYALCSSGLV